MKNYTKICVLLGSLVMLACSNLAFASGDDDHGKAKCPVGLVNNLTLNAEFGPGSSSITHCVKVRHHLKVVVEINRRCRSWSDSSSSGSCSGGPDALGNMENMVKDYEITNGMKRGRDYTMIAIVHGGGGRLLIKGNDYESNVQHLMDEGVKFYFCQNTARGFIRAGILPDFTSDPAGDSATAHLIPGVEYVTAGFTAIADHEAQGWTVVSP